MNEMIEMLEDRRMFSVTMVSAGGENTQPAVQDVVMDSKSAGKVSTKDIVVVKTMDAASTK